MALFRPIAKGNSNLNRTVTASIDSTLLTSLCGDQGTGCKSHCNRPIGQISLVRNGFVFVPLDAGSADAYVTADTLFMKQFIAGINSFLFIAASSAGYLGTGGAALVGSAAGLLSGVLTGASAKIEASDESLANLAEIEKASQVSEPVSGLSSCVVLCISLRRLT